MVLRALLLACPTCTGMNSAGTCTCITSCVLQCAHQPNKTLNPRLHYAATPPPHACLHHPSSWQKPAPHGMPWSRAWQH